MLRITAIVAIALAIAMAATNPAEESHKKAVYTAMAAEAGKNRLLGELAGHVLGDLDLVPYQYHNYIVFSTMTLKGKIVSVGALNRVRPRSSQ